MKFLAFDIGCIECGEDSNVIGVFSTIDEAEEACNKTRESQKAQWSGQHSMEVFQLDI